MAKHHPKNRSSRRAPVLSHLRRCAVQGTPLLLRDAQVNLTYEMKYGFRAGAGQCKHDAYNTEETTVYWEKRCVLCYNDEH